MAQITAMNTAKHMNRAYK